MELDPKTVSSVWWKGALGGALKGIPQGLLLGAIGFAVLTAGIFALGAIAPAFASTWLAGPFGSFLFSTTPAVTTALAAHAMPAFSLAVLNPLPVIALNTVLTVVGNFLTSGDIAVNAYKQDVEHRMNDARITVIESREQMREPMMAQSRAVQKILGQGTRNRDSFEAAEAERETTQPGPTIH